MFRTDSRTEGNVSKYCQDLNLSVKTVLHGAKADGMIVSHQNPGCGNSIHSAVRKEDPSQQKGSYLKYQGISAGDTTF